MSTVVVTELMAQPGRGKDVAELLLNLLGESLQHEGCEIIRVVTDQDEPDHVAALTQWTRRQHYTDYLQWRTDRGYTDTFESMLTQPLVIHYYDELYCGEGVARPTARPQNGTDPMDRPAPNSKEQQQ